MVEGMISVVIPLYNKEKQIRRALKSVLNQTFDRFEVIVVDDGSTDLGIEVVRRFSDKRIKVLKQENRGVSAARNLGILNARNELVAFLDADDEWYPDHLESLYNLFIAYPQCVAWATGYECRSHLGEVGNPMIRCLKFREVGIVDNYFEVASQSAPPVWTSAVMVRRSRTIEIGCFAEEATSGEDLLMWASLAMVGNIAMTRKVSACFHQQKGCIRSESPTRANDRIDVVGTRLKEFYWKSDDVSHLDRYIARWHRMRIAVEFASRNRKGALREALRSGRFFFKDKGIFQYAILSVLPRKLAELLITVKQGGL